MYSFYFIYLFRCFGEDLMFDHVRHANPEKHKISWIPIAESPK